MLACVVKSVRKIFGSVQPEDGQDLVEYALVLMVLVLALISVYKGFGTSLVTYYNNIVATNSFL
jgi:Flp pilus assembly pilin Flp